MLAARGEGRDHSVVSEPQEYVYADIAFREQRKARTRRALQVGLYLIAGLGGFWALHGVTGRNWIFAGIEGLLACTAIALLLLWDRLRFIILGHATFWTVFVFTWLALLLLEGVSGPSSSFNQVWFLTLAVGVRLVLFERERERKWLLVYVTLCFVSFVLAQFGLVQADAIAPVPPDFIAPGRGVAMLAHFASLLVLMQAFMGEADKVEQTLFASNAKLESLLANVLPVAISARLRREGSTFADAHPACTVLFADIVGFTPLTATLPPDAVVRLLDGLFSTFDDLTDRYGLEKIKTIGDAYMAASGLPAATADHAQAAVRLALAMRTALTAYPGLEVRIGINSGEVVAGLIGKQRWVYDLWGDTVNIASRMESHGRSGEIQISEVTYKLVKEEFECRLRGDVAVKGRGTLRVYTVIGPAERHHVVVD